MMRRSTIYAVLLAGACMAIAPLAKAEGSDLIDRIATAERYRDSYLKNFHAEMTYTTLMRNVPAEILSDPHIAKTTSIITDSRNSGKVDYYDWNGRHYSHYTADTQYGKWTGETEFVKSTTSQPPPWDTEWAFDGSATTFRNVQARTGFIKSNEHGEADYGQQFLWQAFSPKHEKKYFLDEYAASKFIKDSVQTSVNGSVYSVSGKRADGSMIVMKFDSSKDCSMTQYELICTMEGSGGGSHERHNVYTFEYQNVGNGYWFPKSMHSVSYNDRPDTVVVDTQMAVDKVEFDQPAETQFQVKYQPEDTLVDFRKGELKLRVDSDGVMKPFFSMDSAKQTDVDQVASSVAALKEKRDNSITTVPQNAKPALNASIPPVKPASKEQPNNDSAAPAMGKVRSSYGFVAAAALLAVGATLFTLVARRRKAL